MLAAKSGRSEVVRQLLEAGANMEAASVTGYTALMIAAYSGHSEVVQQLLEAGANKEAAA